MKNKKTSHEQKGTFPDPHGLDEKGAIESRDPFHDKAVGEKDVSLDFLREALGSKDKEKLRIAVDYIQKKVDGRDPKFGCSPISDKELDKLLETGEGTIAVGSGTSGQRIYIKAGELHMPVSSGMDENYGRPYHNNFRYLFNLGDAEELRVKFRKDEQ